MTPALTRRGNEARWEEVTADIGSGDGWRRRPTLLIGAWALADQALMSGANFASTLLVGRAVAPGEFGRFVLAYTGLWFFQGIQRALIVEPMNVLSATKGDDEYRRYVCSAAIMQILFAGIAGLLVLIAAAAVPAERSLLIAFSAALVAWQCQEYVRRVFYNRAQGEAAFINDVVSYGGQIVALVFLYERGDLTPVSALMAVAATSAIGTIVGVWQARAHLTSAVNSLSVWEVAVANWRFGGWLLGTTSIQETVGRLYIFSLTAIIAPAGLAALTAAVTLCRLPDIAWRAMDTVLPGPASRRFKDHSKAALETYLSRIAIIGLPVVLALTALTFVFAQDLLHHVYGGKYDDFATTLRIAAFASCAYFVSMLLRVALKSVENSRPLFVASLASATLSMTVGLGFAAVWGVEGAASEVALSPAAGMVVLAFGYWRISNHIPDASSNSANGGNEGALKRWLRPSGIMVAVLGADGAGKSTVISELQAGETIHFPPRFPWSGESHPVTDPHGKRPRPMAVSTIKVGYWIVALNLDYIVRLRPRLVRGSVLFLDRCLLDVLVDPRRYRYGGPRWLIRVAWRLAPRPRLVILLDAPVDTLHARKQEVSAAEAERQGQEYRELIGRLPNGRSVDASQSLTNVVASVNCVVKQFRSGSIAGGVTLEPTHEQWQAGP